MGQANSVYRWVKRNHDWFFALLSPIVAVAVPAIDYWLQYNRPARLTIVQDVALDLLSPLGALELPLEIKWIREIGVQTDEVILHHLNLCRVTFLNTGDSPFAWRERVRLPVTGRIKGRGEVLKVIVLPQENHVPVTILAPQKARHFELRAEFLNPREQFAILVFHSSRDAAAIEFEGRIYDHPPILVAKTFPSVLRSFRLVPALVALVLGVTAGYFVGQALYKRRRRARRQQEVGVRDAVDAADLPPKN